LVTLAVNYDNTTLLQFEVKVKQATNSLV